MDEAIRNDLLNLFRANSLVRDTPEVLARRLGRSLAPVKAQLDALEQDGLVAVRWAGGAPLYYYTGSPEHAVESSDTPQATRLKRELQATVQARATLDGVHRVRQAVEQICLSQGMHRDSVQELAIAISEALTNAYRYGRRGDGRDRLRTALSFDEREVEVVVTDRGSGFPSMLVGVSATDGMSTGGRGIALMRSFSDRVEIRRRRGGTEVRLVKRLQPAAPARDSSR